MTDKAQARVGAVRSEDGEPKWEYVKPEYLSHDAPGYEHQLSAGGIMATDDEGEPYWVVEGEIEPKFGKMIVRMHAELGWISLNSTDPQARNRARDALGKV